MSPNAWIFLFAAISALESIVNLGLKVYSSMSSKGAAGLQFYISTRRILWILGGLSLSLILSGYGFYRSIATGAPAIARADPPKNVSPTNKSGPTIDNVDDYIRDWLRSSGYGERDANSTYPEASWAIEAIPNNGRIISIERPKATTNVTLKTVLTFKPDQVSVLNKLSKEELAIVLEKVVAETAKLNVDRNIDIPYGGQHPFIEIRYSFSAMESLNQDSFIALVKKIENAAILSYETMRLEIQGRMAGH